MLVFIQSNDIRIKYVLLFHYGVAQNSQHEFSFHIPLVFFSKNVCICVWFFFLYSSIKFVFSSFVYNFFFKQKSRKRNELCVRDIYPTIIIMQRISFYFFEFGTQMIYSQIDKVFGDATLYLLQVFYTLYFYTTTMCVFGWFGTAAVCLLNQYYNNMMGWNSGYTRVLYCSVGFKV